MLGQDKVLFFPSSYRRSIKYAQRDPANEILRTEVLTKLSSLTANRIPEQSSPTRSLSPLTANRSPLTAHPLNSLNCL